jgi:hypothetical protein
VDLLLEMVVLRLPSGARGSMLAAPPHPAMKAAASPAVSPIFRQLANWLFIKAKIFTKNLHRHS